MDYQWKVVTAYYDETHLPTAMQNFLDIMDEYYRTHFADPVFTERG